MLPLVIDETRIFTFKFWFNQTICNGMCYSNELFCQLGRYDIRDRPKVYQMGCKLRQRGAVVVITHSQTSCHIWASLRAPLVKDILLKPALLNPPPIDHSLAQIN